MRASDRAYTALRDDIIEWRLPPGTVLGEVEQSQRLGVSRTPLREALARLSADGLAVPHAGRGVVVADVSLENVAGLFELRQALECQAAALAARRRDPAVFRELVDGFREAVRLLPQNALSRGQYYELVARLDNAIDEAMDSPYLLQALTGLRVHLGRVRRMAQDNPERLLASAAEHANIADAIATGDGALAAAATSVHLHRSLAHIRDARPQPLNHSAETAIERTAI